MGKDLLILIICLSIGVCIVMWFKSTKKKVIAVTAPNTKDLKELYDEYMNNYVLARLKSPKSATFPDFENRMVKYSGSKITIITYVDSQNSFGALIRSQIKLKFDSEYNFKGASIKGPMEWVWTPLF